MVVVPVCRLATTFILIIISLWAILYLTIITAVCMIHCQPIKTNYTCEPPTHPHTHTHTAPLEYVVPGTVSVHTIIIILKHSCSVVFYACMKYKSITVCRYQRKRTPTSVRSFHPLLPSPRTGRSFRPCSFSMMCSLCSTASLTLLTPPLYPSMNWYASMSTYYRSVYYTLFFRW